MHYHKKQRCHCRRCIKCGWNLQVDGVVKDFVKPFDTVDFVGEGVTITHENKDGKNVVKSNVEIPELPKS